jgi:hypothetical protein
MNNFSNIFSMNFSTYKITMNNTTTNPKSRRFGIYNGKISMDLPLCKLRYLTLQQLGVSGGNLLDGSN